MIAGHAALLAWKSGRPVKMVYDRAEDMAATTKRHPSRTRHRTAVDARRQAARHGHRFRDRRRGLLHAFARRALAGHHSRGRGRTSARTCGSAAAPSPPTRRPTARSVASARRRASSRSSGTWIESRRPSGLAPDELRRRNFIRPGQTSAVGQVIREPIDMAGVARPRAGVSGYRAKRERFARENRARPIKKGIGFAAFMHGAGFTGSGEDHLASVVAVEATRDGRVRVLRRAPKSARALIPSSRRSPPTRSASPSSDVEIVQPDTAVVPNSGPTVASRTCMVVGKLVESAALGLQETLDEAGCGRSYTPGDVPRRCRDYIARSARCVDQPVPGAARRSCGTTSDYQGDAYGAYAWAVYVAEVTVDTLTAKSAWTISSRCRRSVA